MSTGHHFNNIALLITHYNRSSSLERLLTSFQRLNITFGETIVSDDASNKVHAQKLLELKRRYGFTLVSTPVNKGLGNNLNKGQSAVNSPYTLYVQEDFVPTDKFLSHFLDAVSILEEEKDIDIARFYAYAPYPYLKPYKNGFSKMVYKPYFLDKNKIYNYSDHPHLRRHTFFDRFGRYTEGIKSDKTEYQMCLSFIQNKGKAIFFDDYKSLFIQENSSAEPSTVQRSDWRQNDSLIISLVRLVYRQVKYNYDLHVAKKFKRG